MNNRAENFKKFLDENEIKCFAINEIKDDKFNHTEQEVSYL